MALTPCGGFTLSIFSHFRPGSRYTCTQVICRSFRSVLRTRPLSALSNPSRFSWNTSLFGSSLTRFSFCSLFIGELLEDRVGRRLAWRICLHPFQRAPHILARLRLMQPKLVLRDHFCRPAQPDSRFA